MPMRTATHIKAKMQLNDASNGWRKKDMRQRAI